MADRHSARSCSAYDNACAHVELIRTASLSNGAMVDTVRYPLERNESIAATTLDYSIIPGSSGVAVCYSGLLRGFGGERSGALNNHARYLLRPLSALFPGELYVAFSTAYDGGPRGRESDAILPARVRATLEAQAGIVPSTHVLEEQRSNINGSNYMQAMAFGGIEHCGQLVERLAARRAGGGKPFAFAVRMRYDFLVEPRVAGESLSSWPIWSSTAFAAASSSSFVSASTASSSPIFALSKYTNENSTSTKGLLLDGCPWQLPTRRCIPQDVFLVVRASAALGSVESLFLSSHSPARWWLTEGFKSRQHVSERTLLHAPLSLGIPIDLLWLNNGRCAWMLVDERGLGDARAPRAIFRFRCVELRANASKDASADLAQQGSALAPTAAGVQESAASRLPDLLFYSGSSRQLLAVQRIEGLDATTPLHVGGQHLLGPAGGAVFKGWTAGGEAVAVKRYAASASGGSGGSSSSGSGGGSSSGSSGSSSGSSGGSRRLRSESLVQREASIGLGLGHPNVLHTRGFVLASEVARRPELRQVRNVAAVSGAHWLVMDWFSGGDLRSHVSESLSAPPNRSTSPVVARQLMVQLSAGLAHAHSLGVVHRDLHAAHAAIVHSLPSGAASGAASLVPSGAVRLFDFGNALRAASEIPKRHTLRRLPLNFESDGHHKSVASLMEADRYALGLLWLELLLGRSCEYWRRSTTREARLSPPQAGSDDPRFQCASMVDEELIQQALPSQADESARSLPLLRLALKWPPPMGTTAGGDGTGTLLDRIARSGGGDEGRSGGRSGGSSGGNAASENDGKSASNAASGDWEEQSPATELERARGEKLALREWHMSAASRAAKATACAARRQPSGDGGAYRGGVSREVHSLTASATSIAWLHVPKCGSSFGTSLFHLANSSLPTNAQMPTCAHTGVLLKPEVPRSHFRCVPSLEQCTRREVEKCVLGQPEFTFFQRFPLDTHFRCVFWEKGRGNVGGHEPVDETTYARFAGHFHGMFRAPQRRVVSAYLWYASEFHHDPPLPNATTYAQRAKGTQVKMLAGQADGEACNSGYGYWSRCDTGMVPNLALALQRMHEGFAFVGLTDEWALSICLLHAKLGGRCLAVEFENSRPTNSRTTRMPWIRNITLEVYRAAVAEEVASVDDPWDAALYSAVEERFYAEVRQHALDVQRCEVICPDAPRGAFVRAAFRKPREARPTARAVEVE